MSPSIGATPQFAVSIQEDSVAKLRNSQIRSQQNKEKIQQAINELTQIGKPFTLKEVCDRSGIPETTFFGVPYQKLRNQAKKVSQQIEIEILASNNAIDSHADIDALFKQLKEAYSHRRDNHKGFDEMVYVVRRALGIPDSMHWNQAMGLLDAYKPDWRGFVVEINYNVEVA